MGEASRALGGALDEVVVVFFSADLHGRFKKDLFQNSVSVYRGTIVEYMIMRCKRRFLSYGSTCLWTCLNLCTMKVWKLKKNVGSHCGHICDDYHQKPWRDVFFDVW